MLHAVHLHEDFVDEKSIAVSPVLPLQTYGVQCAEFYAPEADLFAAHGCATFGEQILDISVAQAEPVVEPDGVGNDIGRESVSFVSIHPPIPASSVS
jgi:hypothetical protein